MTELVVILILGVIAVGAVASPLLVGVERYATHDELEEDVRRYREALEAGTVCSACSAANASDAAFCGECGRPMED